jgi:precorrin-2 methylase
MMMLPNKKSIASVIIGKIKKPQDESMESEQEMEMEGGDSEQDFSLAIEDAAKKIIEAVESKNPSMLAKHLMDLMDIKSEKEDID